MSTELGVDIVGWAGAVSILIASDSQVYRSPFDELRWQFVLNKLQFSRYLTDFALYERT